MVQRSISKNEEQRTLDAMRRNVAPFESGYNITRIAEELGLARSTVQSRVKKLTEKLSQNAARFEVSPLTQRARSLEELKVARREESARVIQADDERDLIPVNVRIDGPFGLLILGDPHLDDPGCDFALLERHVEIAQNHPFVLAGSIGDHANNWVGRLAKLYADQTVTARESWTLVEWLITSVKWLFIVGGNHDCHDTATECLTRRGWVSADDIRENDEVLSFVTETGGCEWSPILNIVRREHDGELLDIQTLSVNMAVTPNHRILCRDRDWKKEWRDWKYVSANELPARVALPVSAKCDAAGVSLSDDEISLAGWVLTDGSISWKGNSPRVSLYQSKDGSEIGRLLSSLGLQHRHSVRLRNISAVCGRNLVAEPLPEHSWTLGADASRRVLEFLPEKGKLPKWADDLDERQFSIFLDAIVAGDGTWDGSTPEEKRVAVVHGKKKFLDSLQAVAVRHGWYARLAIARGKDYRLNLCKRDTIQFETASATHRRQYKGGVWCLTVPRGNFMVRRGGAAHFSGNCWAGSGDPIQWFSKQTASLYEPHGVRLELQHPCGAKTRIHARHDFPGHSIYNSLHGPKREMLLGYRDHILIAGHKHIGGHESTMTPDGICCTLVRVAGYKKADSYAFQLGLKKMPMHPAALIIIDPSQPDGSPARVHCAPTVEIGVKLLDIARAEYDDKKQIKKAKRRA